MKPQMEAPSPNMRRLAGLWVVLFAGCGGNSPPGAPDAANDSSVMEAVDMEWPIALIRANLPATRPEVWAGPQVAPENV